MPFIPVPTSQSPIGIKGMCCDAITAHMVIVAIRYMILAVERFQNTENGTHEELFYGLQREIVNKMMDCAIFLLLDVMLESVKECFHATEEKMNKLITVFVSKLSEPWKCRFQLPGKA